MCVQSSIWWESEGKYFLGSNDWYHIAKSEAVEKSYFVIRQKNNSNLVLFVLYS